MVIFNPNSKSITVNIVEVAVNTQITLVQVPPGDIPELTPFVIRGNLSRVDTGEGLAGMSILQYIAGFKSPAIWTTDSSGNFVFEVGGIVAGSYVYEAVFEGATVAGLTYNASSARVSTRIGIGEPSAIPVIALVLGAAYLFLKR